MNFFNLNLRSMFTSIRKLMTKSNILLNVLYILSIPKMIQIKNVYLDVLHATSIMMFFGSNIYVSALFGHRLVNSSNFFLTKSAISTIIWRICLILNWISLYLKRHQLNTLSRNFNHLEKKYVVTTNNCKCIVNVIIVIIICSYIYITQLNISFYSNVDRMDDVFWNLIFGYHIKVSVLFKKVFFILYVVISRLYTFLYPLFLSLYYIYQCIIVSNVLRECGEKFTHVTSSFNKKRVVCNFIEEYHMIHEFTMSMESTLSMQVFWLFTSSLTIMFVYLSNSIGSVTVFKAMYSENYLFLVIHGLNFFALTYFASIVYYEDNKLRVIVENKAFGMKLIKQTEECGIIVSQFIRSKPKLVLSAWELFDFNKGTLLKSVGVIVSYNILILHLKVYSST